MKHIFKRILASLTVCTPLTIAFIFDPHIAGIMITFILGLYVFLSYEDKDELQITMKKEKKERGKYKLLKNTPVHKKGDIFSYNFSSHSYRLDSGEQLTDYPVAYVENNPKWFKKYLTNKD